MLFRPQAPLGHKIRADRRQGVTNADRVAQRVHFSEVSVTFRNGLEWFRAVECRRSDGWRRNRECDRHGEQNCSAFPVIVTLRTTEISE